ncbi:hypothetical protein TRVA0_008S01420 [Trichomonascus vanleenenianus]|uniref:borealin N-terminal domain-containing protein n=1 Tax=Trichomonascus vanleenenianus TaxID=2268995 RepID=UPI003ECB41B5
MTSAQKTALIENLKLELDSRINRIRAQHLLASKALQNKIEMRVNRIPKRLWGKTLRELRQEHLEREVNGDQAYHAALRRVTVNDLGPQVPKSPLKLNGQTSPIKPSAKPTRITRPLPKPPQEKPQTRRTAATKGTKASAAKKVIPEPAAPVRRLRSRGLDKK